MKQLDIDKDFDIAVGDYVEPTDVCRGSYRVSAVNRRFPFLGGAMVEVTRTEFVSLGDFVSGKWKILEKVDRNPMTDTGGFLDIDPLWVEELEGRQIPWSEKLALLYEKLGVKFHSVEFTDREPLSAEQRAEKLFRSVLGVTDAIRD